LLDKRLNALLLTGEYCRYRRNLFYTECECALLSGTVPRVWNLADPLSFIFIVVDAMSPIDAPVSK